MYFVIENQTRPDGAVNTTTTARQSFASALSYYHDRFSKMVLTELYSSVSLLLVDENLNKIQHDTIATQYQPPVEEPEKEPAE